MPEYFYPVDVRKQHAKLNELKSDYVSAFLQFSDKVFADGALSTKEKELIAVAVAHATRCPYCIDLHTKRAKAAGATDEQIAEAIFVAVDLSAGASFAHSFICMQSLSE